MRESSGNFSTDVGREPCRAGSGGLMRAEVCAVASIQKRSSGRWRARYKDAEDREHARHFSRKADAELWLAQVRADQLRGTYVDPRAGKITLQEFAEQWLTAQGHRASTRRLYERTMRLHVLPVLGQRPLASIRRTDIQALVTASAEQLAPKTVENHLRLIRAVFNAAVEDRLISVSPVRKISRQPVARARVVPLSVAQVDALVAATPDRYRAMIITAVGSGLRQGELLGLRAADVDLDSQQLHVRHQLVSVAGVRPQLGPPKTESSLRSVPIPDFVVAALRSHLASYPPGPFGVLFTNKRGLTVNRQSLHRSFRSALRTAGLPAGVTFHQLRHTYASLLINAGESPTVVAARLGHKNATETLQTYSHLWPSSADQTRQVLSRAFQDADFSRTAEQPHRR
jgi:integrase